MGLCQPSFKTGFHMSGKSQTVGDFIVSRPSQILLTNENIPDRLELSRTNLESVSIFPARPRFLRWSAFIPDK